MKRNQSFWCCLLILMFSPGCDIPITAPAEAPPKVLAEAPPKVLAEAPPKVLAEILPEILLKILIGVPPKILTETPPEDLAKALAKDFAEALPEFPPEAIAEALPKAIVKALPKIIAEQANKKPARLSLEGIRKKVETEMDLWVAGGESEATTIEASAFKHKPPFSYSIRSIVPVKGVLDFDSSRPMYTAVLEVSFRSKGGMEIKKILAYTLLWEKDSWHWIMEEDP